jgi:hypothetical protein
VTRALAAALLCVAALAGCGGGGDDKPKTPKAAETIEQFQARLKTAVAGIQSGQCDTVEAFNSKAGFALPCEAKAKKLFEGFQVTGAKKYGSGGVVEFKDAEVPAGVGAYTVAVGEDGKYQITGPISPILPASSLKAEPKDADRMDEAAEEMVKAIRDNNCDRFHEWVVTPEGMAKPEACQQELTTAYGPLREELTKAKDAKPERLDGNDRFMFYALQTGDQYRTLIVSRTAAGAPKPFLGFVTFRGPAEKKT